MFRTTLYREIKNIHSEFKAVKDENYTHLYMLLNRLKSAIDLLEFKFEDDILRHVYYNSAIKYLEYPPNEQKEQDGFSGLHRDLDHLLPCIVSILDKDDLTRNI